MLPAAVPNARIIRFGYMSQWFGDNAIRQNVSTVSDRFLRALKRERKVRTSTAPQVLITADRLRFRILSHDL
jgi:hypothetical protein